MKNQTPKYELFGNYGLWNRPFWQSGLFYFFMTVFVFLLACILGYVVWYAIKKRKSQKPPACWRDPYRAIIILSQTSFDTHDALRDAYHQLTTHIKTYIYYRYTCDAHGMTDIELLNFLQNKALKPHLSEHIRTILNGSTGIRFANEHAHADTIHDYIKRGLSFIKETQPRKERKKRPA